MKNFLIFLIIVMPVAIQSQPTIPPDFTMTSIDGTVYNLYTELNQNKPVVLVFFNRTCGTCQAAVPTLENIWIRDAMQGQRGWVWAFENGNASVEQIQTYLNTYGGSFVAFQTMNDDSILTSQYGYNITYTPQYAVVCNRNNYKKIPYDLIPEVFNTCLQQLAVPNNLHELTITITNGFIVLESPKFYKIDEIRLIDILGRVISVVKNDRNSNSFEIPRPALDGLYILNIRGVDGNLFSRKLLINR
ncbi:MAG TPA: T9SS type A sorting domain-containing protein [Salinivirgaceae bacterium]|nr:T9SS type A sorting domain-containing protein [Salinivirgaceae bacterium]